MEAVSVMLAGLVLAGALGAQQTAAAPDPSGTLSPAERARADRGKPPYTNEGLHVMQGMIAHHAHAIVMASRAPTHGARADVARLCKKTDVAQRDEIASMS